MKRQEGMPCSDKTVANGNRSDFFRAFAGSAERGCWSVSFSGNMAGLRPYASDSGGSSYFHDAWETWSELETAANRERNRTGESLIPIGKPQTQNSGVLPLVTVFK